MWLILLGHEVQLYFFLFFGWILLSDRGTDNDKEW